MYQKPFIASVMFAALSVAQEEDGSKEIIVMLDNKRETVYVHATSWSDIDADKRDLDVLGGSRMTFSWSPTPEPESVFKPDLLGGFVTFDVDLSKIGCNCVANFAGFTMPAVDDLEDAYK